MGKTRRGYPAVPAVRSYSFKQDPQQDSWVVWLLSSGKPPLPPPSAFPLAFSPHPCTALHTHNRQRRTERLEADRVTAVCSLGGAMVDEGG